MNSALPWVKPDHAEAKVLKPFTHSYLIISTCSALAALVAQAFFLKLLLDFDAGSTQFVLFLIAVLTGTAVYFGLYKIITQLFRVWGWKMLLRRFDIHGTWYHEFRGPGGYHRRGRTQITQGVFTLNFLGANYDISFDQSSRSLWESHAVTLDNTGQLIFSYSVTRARRGTIEGDDALDKKGLMVVHLCRYSGQRPHKMIGTFEDSSPTKLRGAITWLREPPEWAQNLEEAEATQTPQEVAQPRRVAGEAAGGAEAVASDGAGGPAGDGQDE